MPTNFSESRALYFFLRVSIFVEHLIISEELRKFPNVYEGVPKTFRKCSEELFQPFHGSGLSSTSEIFGYIYNQSYALFFSPFLNKSLLRLNFLKKTNVSVKMVMAWLLDVGWFKSNERVDWCTFRDAWVRDCAYLSIRSQSSPPHRVVNLTSSIPPKLSQSDL